MHTEVLSVRRPVFVGTLVAGWILTLLGPAAGTAARAAAPSDAPCAADNRLMQVVGNHLFGLLPVEQQARVLEGDANVRQFLAMASQQEEPISSTDTPGRFSPAQERLLAGLRARALADEVLPALCFAPGTDEQLVEEINAALGLAETRAQIGGRWTRTATNGSGLSQGQPTTLTYSFVPDGTFVPNRAGVTGNSNLQAFLTGIYGNAPAWQAVFANVFTRWSELSGLTYAYEPNDDGSALNGASGALGVRGDVRISGITIDGSYGILAYNSFPNDGDMVIDSADSFYSNTSSSSLRLRNVVAHEHGHGIGLYHVCPINNTKLMEPFLSSNFDGSQHDDVRGAQRMYGDGYEPDNAPADAAHLGVLSTATPLVVGNPSPPTLANGSTLSIDADGEQDFFRFTTQSAMNLTATVTPVGLNYDDSPQSCSGSGNCCSGDFTNSLLIANLNLEVRATNGTTVLVTGASAAAGAVETVSNVLLATPGDYYVRVYEGDTPSEAQLYRLALSASAASGASCIDGVLNQGEARIDCGGPCPACACTTNATCTDGQFCDGVEVCDAYGDCQAGAPVCPNLSCRENDDQCIAFGNGDYNADGDVDMADFAGLQSCFGAPAVGACTRVNLAGNATVDGADIGAFDARLTGP